MYKYEVGQIVNNFKHHAEVVQFDISDDGAVLLVFFKNPTAEEIEQFKSGKSFEIRFAELYNVIMITAKIGNLAWVDAPYTPHLSKNLTTFKMPADGQGLGLTLMLIDAVTGQIKNMRLLGLSANFTKHLFGIAMEQKTKAFNRQEYDKSINKIYHTYQTKQIVKLSKDYYKING